METPDRPARVDARVVAALTAAAFSLRVWGIDYGIPQPWARPDELRWVRISLALLEDPDPRWFQWPTFHAYLLAAVYWLWGKVAVAAGAFSSWSEFVHRDPDLYPGDLVLVGRAFSSLIGASVVPLTWRLALRLGTRTHALVAAVLTTVAFGPARDAHWALIEPLLLALIVASLIAAWDAMETPTLRSFAAAGLLAGLATSAKYSAATLALPITVAGIVARRRAGESWLGTLVDRRLVLAAAVMVGAFVAGSPFTLVSRDEFMAAMTVREWSYRDASFGTDVGFVHHVRFSLPMSHGWLGAGAGVLGLLLFGVRTPGGWLLLVYGVGTYLALGPARIIAMRYASSLAPCIVIGAAWLVVALARRTRRAAVVAGALAALLAADPLYRLVRFDLLLAREDTRVTTRAWLERYVPYTERLMVRDSKQMRWGRPALEDRWHLTVYTPRAARRREARYLVLTESSTGYIPWAPDVHEVVRDVADLVIRFDPFSADARPVYDPHDAFFVPVAGFEGVKAPGPAVTVYRFRPREEGPGR